MHKPQYRKPVRNLHTLGLSHDTADVNAYRKGSEPALVWAADYGTPSVVKALLARGAKINATDHQGCTALHYAAWNGRGKNVRLLLATWANVNARENDGYTPLMQDRSVSVTQMLLNRGAKVNAATNDGWTALHDVMLMGSPQQSGLLLAAGANVQARDNDGKTPLLFVAAHLNAFSHEDDMEHAKLLLAHGASVNDCDNEGRSVLWHTVRRLNYDAKAHAVVKLLLEAGAVADNENGSRLLQWAKQKGFEDVVALLQAAGTKT